MEVVDLTGGDDAGSPPPRQLDTDACAGDAELAAAIAASLAPPPFATDELGDADLAAAIAASLGDGHGALRSDMATGSGAGQAGLSNSFFFHLLCYAHKSVMHQK